MLVFLGLIDPANGASKNNTTASVPFAIASSTTGLLLVPSVAGMLAEVKEDIVSPSAIAATVNSYPLPLAGSPLLRVRFGGPPIVAVWNASGGAGHVNVYEILG